MPETCKKSEPQTCEGSPSFTLALALDSGVLRYAERTGPMLGQCGPQASLASRLVRPERAVEQMTFGICGHASSICSESADLSFALASRLSTEIRRARGSTEWRRAWRGQGAAPGGGGCP